MNNLKSALAAAIFASFMGACASASDSSSSDATGITATEAEPPPKNVEELLKLLQSSAEGRLEINQADGAWSYTPKSKASAPFATAGTVYFTTESHFEQNGRVFRVKHEAPCGQSACEEADVVYYSSRSFQDEEFGVAINGKIYRYAGETQTDDTPLEKNHHVSYGLLFEDIDGKVAFTLTRTRTVEAAK